MRCYGGSTVLFPRNLEAAECMVGRGNSDIPDWGRLDQENYKLLTASRAGARPGLRDRPAHGLTRPLASFGTDTRFINIHNSATAPQQGSVPFAVQSQVAFSSYKATFWNVPGVDW